MRKVSKEDVLQNLVSALQDRIKRLEEKKSFQERIIHQYQSEIEIMRKNTSDIVAECSERLSKLNALQDSYKLLICEMEQLKSEYDSNLIELIESVRSNR